MALSFGDDFKVHKARGTQMVKGTPASGGGGEPDPEATLWVNASTGDDSRSKATVAASGGSLPWATIGRAVWGSTNRSSPNSSEAAAAGDVVSVAAGSYDSTVSVNNRFDVLYNPVNQGTVGNHLTIVASGVVVISAPSLNGPIIGSLGQDYIKWYADVTQGHRWELTCDGRDSGAAGGGAPNDDTKGAGLVNPRPDTGPVTLNDCLGCWLEGIDIDGGVQIDYTDNWDGIRCEGADAPTIRNCSIRNFNNSTNTTNGACIKLYYTQDALIEHCLLEDSGCGVMVKDVDAAQTSQNNIVRYCWIEGCLNGFGFSLSNEDGNEFYQNVLKTGNIGIFFTGVNIVNEWIYNNVFAGFVDGIYSTESGTSTGNRFWNNIFYLTTEAALYSNGHTWPSGIDLEHNVYYFAAGNFASDNGTTRTFSNFNSTYATQNATSPISITSDPLFTDPGANDYTLQGGSPARDLGRHPDTNATMHAGAYQTGSEMIGLETGEVPTLWVNASTGSDSHSRATIRAGGGSVQWQTIGRAAWGSATRSSPNASEAAEAGDVVFIAAGTYSFSGVIDDRFGVVYNPENEGTLEDPIRFVADGVVILTATDAEAPVIGSNSKDYIEWYADISQGHFWQISACPEDPGGSELCTGAVVACTPDTGPVVFLGTTGGLIEGAQITGAQDSTWGLENWPAIRLENATGVTVRNNEIADFRVSGNVYNGHACAVQMYTCQDCIIEHNYGHNIGAGVALKDNDGSGQFASGNIVRYNLFETVGEAFSCSHVGETLQDEGSDFYQNIVNGYLNAIGGSGFNSDRFYNNTFYNGTLDAAAFTFQIRTASNPGTVDDGMFNVDIVNNIIHTTDYAIYGNGTAMPATSAVLMNRNCYFSFGVQFYTSDVDGNRSFASYQSAYPTQDVNSVNSDPLFTNAAAGDFTLQGGSPAINLGRHPDTNATINAGAYITGSEVIGLEI